MAVGTLTVLRLPPPRRVDPQVAGRAMLLAPLAVLPLGAAVTGLLLVTAETGVPPLARGLLAVALLALGGLQGVFGWLMVSSGRASRSATFQVMEWPIQAFLKAASAAA